MPTWVAHRLAEITNPQNLHMLLEELVKNGEK